MLNNSKGIQDDQFGSASKNKSTVECYTIEIMKDAQSTSSSKHVESREISVHSYFTEATERFKFGDLRDEETEESEQEEETPFPKQNSFEFKSNKNRNSSIKMNPPNYQDLYYLGIKFDRYYILNRNKNPYLYLHAVFLSEFFTCFFTFVIFVVGSNFDVIFVVFFFLYAQSSVITTLIVLKNPPIELHGKSNLINKISRLISAATTAVCIIYGLTVNTPFNSLAFFLFGAYITGFAKCVAVALKFVPNDLSPNCDNYQLRFFMSRIMQGVLNSTAVLDVLSDIVLGKEVIANFQGLARYLGIVLIVLCTVNLVLIYLLVLAPEKVTIQFHFAVVAMQVVILVLTIVVVSMKWSVINDIHFLMLIYLSIGTTVVSLAQQLFLVYDWITFKMTENSQVHTSIIY